MTITTPQTALDSILALQLTVAWAGEGLCEPKRLDWWRTDLVDADGGGDLFARLMPRTKDWACLEAVVTAARQADARARGALAQPDQVRTLFYWGFALDEHLAGRLLALKHAGAPPREALHLPLDLSAAFERGRLEAALAGPDARPAYEITPGGRQLKGSMPEDPAAAARQLAAALLPLAERYPNPFFRV